MRHRIFYAADLHGSDICFRKMLNAAKFYDAQSLILGGDLTGKMVVPFVENPDGTYRSEWLHQKRIKLKELENTENDLANAGLYTTRMSAKEMGGFEGDSKLVYDLFNDLMQDRLRKWIALTQERLEPLGVKLYVIPGNDDRFEIDDPVKQSEFMVYCEGKVVDIGGYEVASCGYTNPTPWHTPREEADDVLKGRLDSAMSQIGDMENAILNFHCPPKDTALDIAPQLSPDFKIVAKFGTAAMQHVGSRSVRELILDRQPLLGLHGHIHESKGEESLGRTLVVNPGSDYNQGVLHGVLVDLEDGKVVNHQFTMG